MVPDLNDKNLTDSDKKNSGIKQWSPLKSFMKFLLIVFGFLICLACLAHYFFSNSIWNTVNLVCTCLQKPVLSWF